MTAGLSTAVDRWMCEDRNARQGTCGLTWLSGSGSGDSSRANTADTGTRAASSEAGLQPAAVRHRRGGGALVGGVRQHGAGDGPHLRL